MIETPREELIQRIVLKEWRMFDRVHNEGGRADCQDDWPTFSVMRASQMEAWRDDTLASYDADLDAAEREGRDLLEEKYARMMASTDPEAYARLEPHLPPVTEEKRALVERCVARQLEQLLAMAPRYPHVLASMRSLRTADDTRDATSLETYQRGELLTYSERTLRLYEEQLNAPGYDYGRAVLEDMARAWGFDSLEELEARMAKAAGTGGTSSSFGMP